MLPEQHKEVTFGVKESLKIPNVILLRGHSYARARVMLLLLQLSTVVHFHILQITY